jgi:iron complex outermembrane recepter protein
MRVLFLLAVLVCCAGCGGASGHQRHGNDLVRRGHHDEGIRELKAAYASDPRPEILLDLARAYDDMGDWDHASVHYRRYLETDPPDAASVRTHLETAEKKLAKQRGAAPKEE